MCLKVFWSVNASRALAMLAWTTRQRCTLIWRTRGKGERRQTVKNRLYFIRRTYGSIFLGLVVLSIVNLSYSHDHEFSRPKLPRRPFFDGDLTSNISFSDLLSVLLRFFFFYFYSSLLWLFFYFLLYLEDPNRLEVLFDTQIGMRFVSVMVMIHLSVFPLKRGPWSMSLKKCFESTKLARNNLFRRVPGALSLSAGRDSIFLFLSISPVTILFWTPQDPAQTNFIFGRVASVHSRNISDGIESSEGPKACSHCFLSFSHLCTDTGSLYSSRTRLISSFSVVSMNAIRTISRSPLLYTPGRFQPVLFGQFTAGRKQSRIESSQAREEYYKDRDEATKVCGGWW